MSTLLEKQNRKIEAIMAATLNVMDEHGLEGSSMALIAEKSKVAAGTIYRYFKNKEDLINALYKEVLTDLIENLNFLGIEGSTIRSKYKKLWEKILSFHIKYPQKVKFLAFYYYSPAITEEARSTMRNLFMPIRIFFQQAIEQEVIKNLPIPMLVSFTMGPIHYLSEAHKVGRMNLNEQNKALAFQASWDALKY